jgi:ribosomal protein S21
VSIEVKKKDNESINNLLRRFRQKVESTRHLITVKSGQFYTKKPNKRAQKESALKRKQSRDKREYLKKIGQIEDEPRGYQYKK